MTVFEVLRRKHRELDAAFDAIERTDSFADADAKFRDLATRIVAYLRAERTVVYPRLASADGLRIDANEVAQVTRVQERIEKTIDHLRLGALGEPTWRAAARTLREQLVDLANLEEWVVFPLASLAFSSAELRAIAAELLAYEPVALRVSSVTITYDAPDLDLPMPVRAPIVATVPPLPDTTPIARIDPFELDFDPFEVAA
jgi:hypothetical protein